MMTAPPTVPGIPLANSKPVSSVPGEIIRQLFIGGAGQRPDDAVFFFLNTREGFA